MTTASNLRRAAILWLVAAALSLAAGLISLGNEGQVKWASFAAAVFMAVLGWSTLQRSKSSGV